MTFGHFTPLFEKYRSQGLLLDTNLLLLLLIGSGAPHLLGTFKPTLNQGFRRADFELLTRACSFFETLVTTPHILTEVSNHCAKLKGLYRHQVFQAIRAITERLEERFSPSRNLALRPAFMKFGLADIAITEVAANCCLVMTVDFELVGHIASNGADAINFNHLRQIQWES
jgi:hypothetical protein